MIILAGALVSQRVLKNNVLLTPQKALWI